ncbi:MAG: replication factor C large subunit [Candidatus Micrarchaeota archaeon]|nr:replication factor C large subunit [Candidatus Micrarchaeota archaeon]
MLLSAKKPTSLSALIGNAEAISLAKQWAESWQKGKPQPPLLVCGPAGTGKTALAYAIASELGWEVFEFNASELRNEQRVRHVAAAAASSSSLFGLRKLVLIDDADSLSSQEDKGGASAIASLLKESRQPILLTATDYYDRKLSSIKSHCQHIELRRATPLSLTKFLREIAKAEKIPLSEEEIGKIAQASGGDVRAALNDLQGRNASARRDVRQNIFDVLRRVLKSENYSESRMAIFESEVDFDALKLWVAHNIPIEYDRPFDIAEAYCALSRADVFDGRAKRSQYFGYLRYANDHLSAGVALAKSAPYKKYTPLGFPDYLREMSATKASRASRKSVLAKIGRACHCSPSQSQTYLPLLSALAKKHPTEISSYFGFDEGELDFITKSSVEQKPPAKSASQKQRKNRA